ncbi:MAG: hypothetical protein ACFFD4_29555 [Candidatus Odinarchaeota archaeon]
MASFEIILLSIFTIIMAVAALEVEKMSQAIVYLALTAVGVGTIFLYLGAMYAAMFEYLIYGGVLIILFMAAAAFAGKEEKADKEATK